MSDNPLWVPPEHATAGEEAWGWVSGANFLAAPPAEILDGLRKTLTQIVKLADRHLALLVSPHLSNGLPANLSDAESVTGCAFKGVQIQAGMFVVYATLLANPVTTLFGVHEEGNQDITTHSMTSGIVGFELLSVTRYALAQQLLALAQATDLRGGSHLLAPASATLYRFVRAGGVRRREATVVPRHRSARRRVRVGGTWTHPPRRRAGGLRMTGDDWRQASERHALALFRQAAARVPAYTAFLREHHCDPAAVETPADFRRAPVTTKANYIDCYPLAERMWDGSLAAAVLMNASSGTTGVPYFWPCDTLEIDESTAFYDALFRTQFEMGTRRTLLVICFGMGTWIAGSYTLHATLGAVRAGLPGTVVSPGFDKAETLGVLRRLAPAFDQVVLAGIPSFLKDLVDE